MVTSLNYSAFSGRAKKIKRLWPWLVIGIIALMVGSAIPATQLAAVILAAIGMLAIRLWTTQIITAKREVWRQFAHANGFMFAEEQNVTDRPALLAIKPIPFIVNSYHVTGTLNKRWVQLGVVECRGIQGRIHNNSLTYFGVLEVRLSRSYKHLVLDKFGRNWEKQSAVPSPGVDDLTTAPYTPYILPGTFGNAPQPEAFYQFIQAVCQIANVDIELYGDKLYFVQPDGISQTPKGIEQFFKLAELVDIFDTPTALGTHR